MRVLKKGNKNTKLLACTAKVRQILEYGAAFWDRYRLDQVSALNRLQKRGAKFANNINELGWRNFGTAKIDSPKMRPFQGISRGDGLGMR